jgi:chromosome segregation ATPase
MCICCIALLFNCTTTKNSRDDLTRDIVEYQKQIAVLEERIRQYDNAIDRAVTRTSTIRRTAESSASTIEDIIRLFDEYNAAVDELLRDYKQLTIQNSTEE